MTSFFGELRRRNVVKVAVAYAIVGWVLIEVSSVIAPAMNLPDWATSLVVFFVILGFPLALVLSWAYEITPDGMKRSHEVPAPESITHVTGRKLDFAIIGALVMALGFVVYNYVLEDDEEAVGVLPNSVAVIPFENVSPNPDDAYYATGIHDEILNQLAKLSALNVIARTSMQQYANTEKSIPEIARELNVETVMEGSVRYSGGRIRITAQLNDGVTGAHLWSETYTRDFDDIFAIESDVAMNVANALEAEFSLEEQASIEKIPTNSPEAFALYLSGISHTDPLRAISDLRRATEIDPNFADAYAQMAFWQALSMIGFGGPSPSQAAELERLVQSNAERALTLDSTLGVAYAALGAIHLANWRGEEAEEALLRAYELSPNGAGVAQMYARFKRHRREYSEAIELMERVVELDPNNPTRQQNLGVAYRYAGDYERAAAVFRTGLELQPTSVTLHVNLAIAEVGRGDHSEALRQLNLAEVLSGEEGPNTFRLAQMARVYSQAGRQDDAMRMFNVLEQKAQEAPVGEATWASAYAAIGDHERALEHLETAVRDRVPTDSGTLGQLAANVFVDPVLETDPRYRELLSGLWSD